MLMVAVAAGHATAVRVCILESSTALLKFGTKIITFAQCLEINIQQSICVCLLFTFIAYTHDDLC